MDCPDSDTEGHVILEYDDPWNEERFATPKLVQLRVFRRTRRRRGPNARLTR